MTVTRLLIAVVILLAVGFIVMVIVATAIGVSEGA